MAPLPRSLILSLQKFRLRMDVEDLQNAYRSALTGLRHRESEIEDMVRSQLGIASDDEWPERDDEDPDDPIGALYDHAADLDDQSKRGAPMIRRAFLIALFHAWERYFNARLQRAEYDYKVVREAVIRDGHASLWGALRQLQLAANCAKHGPGNACGQLYAQRPDFFPRAVSPDGASDKTMGVTEEMLEHFFAAVFAACQMRETPPRHPNAPPA